MVAQVSAPGDFDFAECVNAHGWRSLLPFRWNAETRTLQRVEQFGDTAPVLLTITPIEHGLSVEGAKGAPVDEVVRRVRRMLQLDLPIADFHSFCTGHSKLSHVPRARQGRLLRSPTLFEDYLKVVATTNTTWAQTKAMVARVVEGLGAPIPDDPGLKAFPGPERIAAVSLDEFAAVAKMGYRNAAVHRVATDMANGELELERLQDPCLSANEVYKSLLALPGVGPYAASCLMIYLGRYSRVNVDSWARALVGNELGRKVTDKEVHVFFEPYAEWKALAYHFYPWRKDEPAA